MPCDFFKLVPIKKNIRSCSLLISVSNGLLKIQGDEENKIYCVHTGYWGNGNYVYYAAMP